MKLRNVGNLVLAAALTVSLLTGCGGGKDSGDGAKEGQTQGNVSDNYDAEGNWTGETYHIIMTLITSGSDPVDMQKVQDAVNELSVKKAGVEVEFKPVSVFDAPSQVPMWIGAGEQIDLMACAFTGISPYIDMNMLEPIENLLSDYAPGIKALEAEGTAVFDSTSTEHTYGVLVPGSFDGAGGGYMFPVNVLEEAGYSYKNWDKITLDELGEIFAKIKESHPDSYMGVLGNLPAAGNTMMVDALGATTASGVLIGTDSTKVVNYFETEEYLDYLRHVRSWYEKGYILKDAATSDAVLSDNIKNGTFIGNFTNGDFSLLDLTGQDTGKEWIALMFHEPYMASISPAAATYWTVPVTAAEPEAAVRFLDLMVTDSEIANLLLWGIEGDHYTLSEEGAYVKTENTVNWNIPGLHASQKVAIGNGAGKKEMDEKWSKTARENMTKGYGFCYNASSMTNQLTAVEAVITEYQAALETGSADLDKVYPEFISKLKQNGIEEIIADKQAQFDAWLAEQGE